MHVSHKFGFTQTMKHQKIKKKIAMRLHDFRNALPKKLKDWMLFKAYIGGKRFNLSYETLF